MTNAPKKPASLTHLLSTHHSLNLALLLISFCIAGCSSRCNRSSRISRIADQQLVVIDTLKMERESAAVSGPVQKDAALRRAEAHLSEALGALKRSVEAIKQEEEK